MRRTVRRSAMKKAWMLAVALAAFASTGSAQRSWRGDDRHGARGEDRYGANDRDRYGRRESGARDFIGTWRLENRRGDERRGWGSADRFRPGQASMLPEWIQIERDRRELRVEN